MRICNIFLLCVFGLCFFGNAAAGLDDGLIAHYPFDSNANDISGNGNHAVESGGITYVAGKNNQSASFDGENDFIHLPSIDNIGFVEGTITLWVKVKNGFSSGRTNMNLFSKDNAPYEKNTIEILFDGSTGKIRLDYGDYGDSIYSNSNVWSEDWYHVAFSWGDVGLKMYINAEKQKDTLNIISPVGGNTLTHIGTHQAGSNFIKGNIDDVRIYNRVLSGSEIQELFVGKSSCTSAETGTVSSNLDIHMPSLSYQSLLGTQNIWADLEYKGTNSTGQHIWGLKDFGVNQ